MYIGQTAGEYQGGTPGGSAFNLHYINEVNGYYCDASCGSAMCSTKTEFARKYLKIVYYVSGVEKTISGDKLDESCFQWGD